MTDERIAFVCYTSFLDAVEKLPQQLQGQAALAIMRLGINGEWDGTEPVIDMMLTLIKPLILAAKNRYAIAVENGKKGGRPAKVDIVKIKKLIADDKNDADIAGELGCTTDYVRKLRKELNPVQNNQKNLNIDKDKDKNIDTANEVSKGNSASGLELVDAPDIEPVSTDVEPSAIKVNNYTEAKIQNCIDSLSLKYNNPRMVGVAVRELINLGFTINYLHFVAELDLGNEYSKFYYRAKDADIQKAYENYLNKQ